MLIKPNNQQLTRVTSMGMSKKDLSKARSKLKVKIAELEEKARMDPLKKNPRIHEELAKLKNELESD